jgi:predicted RNase H-like HicB family nuclease
MNGLEHIEMARWLEGGAMTQAAAYIVLVHKDEGTSYGVSFPDVPGCISAGDTLEQALVNAREALSFHFDGMRDDGDPIPAPRSYEQLRKDPEFVAEAADAIVAAVQRSTEPSHDQ